MTDKTEEEKKSAENEADEAILSLALTTKVLSRKLQEEVRKAKDQTVVDPETGQEVPLLLSDKINEISKTVLVLSEAALKLGKRAEEIVAKRRRELQRLSDEQLVRLSTERAGNTKKLESGLVSRISVAVPEANGKIWIENADSKESLDN